MTDAFDSWDEFEVIIAKKTKKKKSKAKEITPPVEMTEEVPEEVKDFLEGKTDEVPEGTEVITVEEAEQLKED